MKVVERLGGWLRKRRGGTTLKQNMEKALHMKQEAPPQTNIPEHRTAREGMHPADDPHRGESGRAADAGFTPQLKRSRVARSGDT